MRRSGLGLKLRSESVDEKLSSSLTEGVDKGFSSCRMRLPDTQRQSRSESLKRFLKRLKTSKKSLTEQKVSVEYAALVRRRR